MPSAPETITELAVGAAPPAIRDVGVAGGRSRFVLGAIPSASNAKLLAWTLVDQALAVGGGLLVNVALARTQTKEEYGLFALSYSFFTLIAGLQNAAILEPYTVYASGRYRERFSEYLRLMVRTNAGIGAVASGTLLVICLALYWLAPQWFSRALLGLAITAGILMWGPFLRRVFYLQRQPPVAAKMSLAFFLSVAGALWVAIHAHRLNSFSVYLILAFGWIVGGASFARRLALGQSRQPFLNLEPRYWQVHWRYARWVVVTACVFQLTSQGYYWIVAGFLSVKEVAELKAMYLVVAPAEQIAVALSLLILPVLASHFSARRNENFLSLWKRYALAVVSIAGGFAVLVRMAGRSAIHVIYAGKFDECAPLLFTLALLPLVMGLGNTMNDALKAAEKPGFVFYAYLCSGAATFLGGIPLVMRFGLQGAAYGLLLSAAVYSGALTVGFLNVMSARRGPLGSSEKLA